MRTIREKFIIAGSVLFLFMVVTAFFLTDYQLKKIIDNSQNQFYYERVKMIESSLTRANFRLKKTGLVDACVDDFKKVFISELKQEYYNTQSVTDYPFIIDEEGGIVVHPKALPGDSSFIDIEYLSKIISTKNGDFNFKYKSGGKGWCIYRYFAPWRWIIVYSVPLSVKYADVDNFRAVFVLIIVVMSLVGVMVFSVIVTGLVRPITRLTTVATEMAEGKLDASIDIDSNDELGLLAKSFIRMRDSIRDKIDQIAKQNTKLLNEVAERKKVEKELVAGSEEMHKRHSVIVDIATNSDLYTKDFGDAVKVITKLAGETLGVDRTSFWFFYQDRGLKCIDSYNLNEHSHSGLEDFSLEQIPCYLEFIKSSNSLNISDVSKAWGIPEVRELKLNAYNIKSTLHEVVRVEGKMVGVLVFEQMNDTRFWSSVDVAFASQICDQISHLMITMERVQARKAIIKSENDLRITLNSIGDAVIATDAEGVITRMNPVATEMAGVKIEQALGKNFNDIFKVIDDESKMQVANPVFNAMHTGKIAGIQHNAVVVTHDGRSICVANSGAPIKNEEGKEIGVVIVLKDITEQLRVEEELNQAQKMDSIGQLAGGVAHDFNNMLGGILGAADLIKRKLDDDSPIHKYIKIILQASTHASALTQQLLDFSRKGRGVNINFDLHESIQDAMALLERSIDKKIDIKMSFDAKMSVILGDPSQIQNVFLNLGINARDAMPEGGNICISSRNCEISDEFCDKSTFNLTSGIFIEVSVTDTGHGIPEEIMERIFEPFYTTKEVGGGTGLGLAAVYGTIKDHKGAIEVISNEAEGSRFKILLPVDLKADIDIESLDPVKASLAQRKRGVLVVDDEDIMRDLVAECLKESGYKVMTAYNGKVAIEKYMKFSDNVELVILDMVMPIMSGEETFKALRKINPELKIILCSGFTRTGVVNDLLKNGAVGFIQKPYREEELLKIVFEHI